MLPYVPTGYVLPAWPHEFLIELVNANRQTLDKRVATFLIPKGIDPDGHL